MNLPINIPFDLLKIIKEYSGDPKYNRVMNQLNGIIYSFKFENKIIEVKSTYGSGRVNTHTNELTEIYGSYTDIHRFINDISNKSRYQKLYSEIWRKHYFTPYKKKPIKQITDYMKLKGLFRF